VIGKGGGQTTRIPRIPTSRHLTRFEQAGRRTKLWRGAARARTSALSSRTGVADGIAAGGVIVRGCSKATLLLEVPAPWHSIEPPWSQFTSDCRWWWHPPRPNNTCGAEQVQPLHIHTLQHTTYIAIVMMMIFEYCQYRYRTTLCSSQSMHSSDHHSLCSGGGYWKKIQPILVFSVLTTTFSLMRKPADQLSM
jgi:hypothetical protein